MSFVRQFKLANSDGVFYNITTKQALLTDPKGLGVKRDNNYRRVGNRFYLLSKRRVQEDFTGELVLTPPDAYIKYNEFLAFCAKEPLKLIYRPIDNYEYYMQRGAYPLLDYEYTQDVMIHTIEKGDLTKYETLECKIALTPLTPWYRIVFETSHVDNYEGMVWEETSEWPFRWENGTGKDVQIESDCHIDSPCKLMIPGPIVNPSWCHYVNGKRVAEGSVDCTVPFGHQLVIDNTTENYSITIINGIGDVVADVYQNADFPSKRFIEIQNGINSIFVDFEDGNNYDITVEAMLFYESV